MSVVILPRFFKKKLWWLLNQQPTEAACLPGNYEKKKAGHRFIPAARDTQEAQGFIGNIRLVLLLHQIINHQEK